MSLNEFPPAGPDNHILPEDEPYAVPTPASPEKPAPGSDSGAKKGCLFGMGCFSCGALGCLGIVVLLALMGVAGWNWFVTNILSDSPLDFPAIEMTAKEEEEYKAKLADFQKQLESNTDKTATISLTPKELNYEIQKSASKENLYLNLEAIDEDKLAVKMSVPLEFPDKKKFMNLSFKGKMKVDDYDIKAVLDRMKIGKLDISDKHQLEGASDSFSRELQTNENFRKLPVKIKNFEVKDGLLIFEVKKKTDEVKISEPTDTEKESDIN